MIDDESLYQSVIYISKYIQTSNQQAVREYTSIVERILYSRSLNSHHIEQTLDGMLGFCGHNSILILYKKLCRHYYFIDAVATAAYVRFYREMWEADSSDAGERG